MPQPHPPALDPMSVATDGSSLYPPQFQHVVKGRLKRRLSPELGLTNFGVNLTTLQPGAASTLRHWHEAQDEFIYVVSGQLTLVTDAGKQVLGPGMCAGFPKGKPDGHHLINETGEPASFLEVGDRTQPDKGHYADVDMAAGPDPVTGKVVFTRKDGTSY